MRRQRPFLQAIVLGAVAFTLMVIGYGVTTWRAPARETNRPLSASYPFR